MSSRSSSPSELACCAWHTIRGVSEYTPLSNTTTQKHAQEALIPSVEGQPPGELQNPVAQNHPMIASCELVLDTHASSHTGRRTSSTTPTACSRSCSLPSVFPTTSSRTSLTERKEIDLPHLHAAQAVSSQCHPCCNCRTFIPSQSPQQSNDKCIRLARSSAPSPSPRLGISLFRQAWDMFATKDRVTTEGKGTSESHGLPQSEEPDCLNKRLRSRSTSPRAHTCRITKPKRAIERQAEGTQRKVSENRIPRREIEIEKQKPVKGTLWSILHALKPRRTMLTHGERSENNYQRGNQARHYAGQDNENNSRKIRLQDESERSSRGSEEASEDNGWD